MHGGALGSGAPRGNKNALKHGRFTREAIAERGQVRDLVRQARKCSCRLVTCVAEHQAAIGSPAIRQSAETKRRGFQTKRVV